MYAQLPNTPGSFWTYRRLIAKEQFKPDAFSSDLSMINWDSNDVCDQGLLSTDPVEQAKSVAARESRCHWRLRGGCSTMFRATTEREPAIPTWNRRSALGSADGLSQFPYVREARRMKALRTIHEQDVATAGRASCRFRRFRRDWAVSHRHPRVRQAVRTFLPRSPTRFHWAR